MFVIAASSRKKKALQIEWLFANKLIKFYMKFTFKIWVWWPFGLLNCPEFSWHQLFKFVVCRMVNSVHCIRNRLSISSESRQIESRQIEFRLEHRIWTFVKISPAFTIEIDCIIYIKYKERINKYSCRRCTFYKYTRKRTTLTRILFYFLIFDSKL